MPQPIQVSGEHVDLGPRIAFSKTVTGSPALAAETIICTSSALGDLAVSTGVLIVGWCAFTMGTSGVSATLKIRQTNVAGATVATSGATLGVATGIYNPSIVGIDAAPVLPGQLYVLTLTIGSGAATSTVSAAGIIAIAC
jgi:hypothetical protein